MTAPSSLPVDRLRRRCDPAQFEFETTADVEPIDGLIGQTRALDALRFGVGLNAKGFNIFVLGTPGSGRHNAVGQFLNDTAKGMPAPDDWVYVHNFDEPHRPQALRLPAGRAPELAKAMDGLIDGLKTAMPAVFESEDYQARRKAIDEEFQNAQQGALKEVADKAEREGLGLMRTANGFGIVPVKNGKPVEPDVFEKLPKAEREAYQEKIEALGAELAAAIENVPKLDKIRRERLHNLNRQLAEIAVNRALADLIEAFCELTEVCAFLDQVREDLVENAVLFVETGAADGDGEQMLSGNGSTSVLDRRFNRYKINVVVSHGHGKAGAPVIYDDFPGLGRLVGRIEHVPHMGAMLTDFTLIKPGSLHRANGGFLMLDAERLISEPFAWQALKRALRSQTIAIESPTMTSATTTAIVLEPEPIDLDVKVILFGERRTFYALSQLDPDYGELFKVAADFEDILHWTGDTVQEFARLIGSIAQDEKLCPLTPDGVAAVIERASRMADDSERLSLRVGPIADLLREADYWTLQRGREVITAEDVRHAVSEQIRRLDRVRERMHEQILRETMLVDTEGSEIGQINGLSVLAMGNFSFGKPTRITARVRIGAGKVVDIEREVELGGPLHTKGVLILNGFLAARYARDVPISLAATLVFEQSYGGVDGDSASSTELYALLSALSGAPIRQDLSVTGSVNQNGEVQAIGGVNEKIEGFFDICTARGLTGSQGVLIPVANVKHLMLRDDVVAACRGGKFHVYPVATIDEGIALLTGAEAGQRDGDGVFPDGSINARVESRLIAFAEQRRAFMKGAGEEPLLG